MKRLIVLDCEEFNALSELASATGSIMPTHQTVNLYKVGYSITGLHYLFDTEESEEVEKILLTGTAAGLRSP